MRILHLTHYFLPESQGGTQAYVAHLSQYQSSLGHEVAVITGSPRVVDTPQVENSIWQDIPSLRIFRCGEEERFSGDVGSARILGLVKERVEGFAPDLCHIHHWHGLSRGLVPMIKELGIPVVVTLHDLFTTCMRFFRMPSPREFCGSAVGFDTCAACVSPDLPNRSLAEIEAFARDRFQSYQGELNAADAVFCVSLAQGNLLQSIPGFDLAKMKVLPIGVPKLYASHGTYSTKLTSGPLKVVSWGGVEPRKGAHLIASALAKIGDPTDFELHLHGEVASPEYAQEIVAKAGAVPVTFHGRYSDERMARFAAEYDLAVFPFIAFETYALSVDEALHLGIPLVVCDRGAPKERLGGRGRVFPAEDVSALAKLIDELRRNPSRLRTMAENHHSAKLLPAHGAALDLAYGVVLGDQG